MTKSTCSAALLLFSAALLPAQPSPEAVKLAKVAAPFITNDTMIVAHLDVAEVDLDAVFEAAVAGADVDNEQKQSAREALAPIVAQQKELADSGVIEALFIFGTKVSGTGAPEGKPQLTLIVRKSASSKADDVVERVKSVIPFPFSSFFAKTWVAGDWIAMGPEDPKAASKKNTLKPVKELTEVFDRMLPDGKGLHAAFLPQPGFHKSFTELFKKAHAMRGYAPRSDEKAFEIALAGKRTTLSIVGAPAPKVICQADTLDNEAAKTLIDAASESVEDMAKMDMKYEPVTALVGVIGKHALPKVDGKTAKLTLDVSDGSIAKGIGAVLSTFFPTRAALARERLKNLGTALVSREELFAGYMPAQLQVRDGSSSPEYSGKPSFSWRVVLLAYLDVDKVFNEIEFDQTPDSPQNVRALKSMPEPLRHPLFPDDPPDTCRYAVPRLPGGAFESGPMVFRGVTKKDITDGPENTIAIVVLDKPVPYKLGDNWNVDPSEPTKGLLIQDGKITVVLFDGSVVDLDASDKETIRGMLTIAGGEKIERK
jgi:hypothetical protein